MAQTTPSVFGTAAYNTVLSNKNEPQNNLAQISTYTVPALTAQNTVIGMIPFETGFSLLSYALKVPDLDSSTNVTYDVGYCYPAAFGSSTTEDLAAFATGASAQAATSVLWPVAAGLLTGVSFTATQPGYITIKITGGATTTEGTFSMIANFTYNMAAN
jgi:hypothetical protein